MNVKTIEGILVVLMILLILQGCRYSKPLFHYKSYPRTHHYSTDTSIKYHSIVYWSHSRPLSRMLYKNKYWHNYRIRYEKTDVVDSSGKVIRKEVKKYVPGALDQWPPPGIREFHRIYYYDASGRKVKAEYSAFRYKKKYGRKRSDKKKIIKELVDKTVLYDEKGKKTIINNLKNDSTVVFPR